MDNLTEKGLKYINTQKGAIYTFAKEKIPLNNQEDIWIMLNIIKHREAQINDELVDLIDINIWLDVETNKWKAAAYPMEINSLGKIQTNTQDFIELF